MKLYTRTGDDGTTALHGGRRVGKDDPRIAAIGAIDELNAHIGLAGAVCHHEELNRILTVLQNRLFDLGADLASADGDAPRRIEARHILEAEQQIDQICEPLEPLKAFILPGGGALSARLHVARAVCRRAECQCIVLDDVESIVIYVNRLSDLLFALARRANQLDGIEDVQWNQFAADY